MEVVNETNKIVTVEGMGRRNIARDRQHSRLLIAEKKVSTRDGQDGSHIEISLISLMI
jgi:hypothetical protein